MAIDSTVARAPVSNLSKREPIPVVGLCEGDEDPGLNKTIKFLIARREDYIVYLDPECGVQWRVPFSSVEAKAQNAHEVLNEVSLMETLSLPLVGTEHLEPVRRLLGESVARLFSGGEGGAAAAKKILADARAYLQNRMAEMARIWYLSAAGLFAVLALLAMALMWTYRDLVSNMLGPMTVELALGSGLGAVGAFMSLLTRSAEIRVAAGAGRKIHYVEALSRVAAGGIGAVFVVLAIKSNVLLGLLSTPDKPALLYLLCLVAGASERLVPGIIGRIEASTSASQIATPEKRVMP